MLFMYSWESHFYPHFIPSDALTLDTQRLLILEHSVQFHSFGPLRLPAPVTLGPPPPFLTWRSPIPPSTLS